MCPNCDMARVRSEVADLVESIPDNSRWVTLWDCGHTLPVSTTCCITITIFENVAFGLCYSNSGEASRKRIIRMSMACHDLDTRSCWVSSRLSGSVRCVHIENTLLSIGYAFPKEWINYVHVYNCLSI